MNSFYSHGKLLLSAEYMVLKGARALAVPCKLGQSLSFEEDSGTILKWNSLDKTGRSWFNAEFSIIDFSLIKTNNLEIAKRLNSILIAIRKQNKEFIKVSGGEVITRLEFNREWGLGTSSTLIANLSKWAGVNPYILLDETFRGSGYDIACASAGKPLFYTRGINTPKVESCDFNPTFKSALYFVYLNQKKNSREAVEEFMQKEIKKKDIVKINELSSQMAGAKSLKNFDRVLKEHESFVGQLMSIQPIKEKQFKDFSGEIKSLGAWGGDFILATGDSNTPEYFSAKGFPTVFGYDELIL
tara:strand:- start:7785 stop:8684 length:900 start_codon:yes stop_codon:yes gene_type:complete